MFPTKKKNDYRYKPTLNEKKILQQNDFTETLLVQRK